MRLREELDRVGYAAGAIVLKLHRWQHVVVTATATATAAVCAVTVMGGSNASARPASDSGLRVAARSSIVQATAAPPVVVAGRGAPPLGVRPSAAASRGPLDDLSDGVRHKVTSCGSSGRQVPIRYEGLIREAKRSIDQRETLLAARSPCPKRLRR
jgi:hypothetical protein